MYHVGGVSWIVFAPKLQTTFPFQFSTCTTSALSLQHDMFKDILPTHTCHEHALTRFHLGTSTHLSSNNQKYTL